MTSDLPAKNFLKFVIIGPPSVGKTSLIGRFADGTFSEEYRTTIGADFTTKTIDINGESCVIQLWDTAGQERYRALGGPFYRGASALMIVFDVTDPPTLEAVVMWRDEFMRQCEMDEAEMERFPTMLIGNKMDLDVRVTKDDVEQFQSANTLKLPYVETSAKEGSGVEEAFVLLANVCYGAEEFAERNSHGGAVGGGYDHYFSDDASSMADTITSDKLSALMSDTAQPDAPPCACTIL